MDGVDRFGGWISLVMVGGDLWVGRQKVGPRMKRNTQRVKAIIRQVHEKKGG